MLEQWIEWLEADAALTTLPNTLPDRYFATTTHLNARGRARFTETLAAQLRLQRTQ
jgi:hypothetical protein